MLIAWLENETQLRSLSLERGKGMKMSHTANDCNQYSHSMGMDQLHTEDEYYLLIDWRDNQPFSRVSMDPALYTHQMTRRAPDPVRLHQRCTFTNG